MVKTSVTIKDNGKDRMLALMKLMKQYSNAYVTIGLHEDAGEYTDGGQTVSVVDVGLWNEYGTETAPERSFFRTAIDENEDKIDAWREHVITQILENGMTVDKALDFMGFNIAELIRNKIKSNIPPPNAPSTMAAKEAKGQPQMTLQATGLMLRSVTYKKVLE